MKRIINIIVHPAKMLTSRNEKNPPVNIVNENSATPMYESSSRKRSGNYEVVGSCPSGNNDSRKKVVFNDTVGYRVFRKDSLCVENH